MSAVQSIKDKGKLIIGYIVYHNEPHFDEFVGGLLARYFGHKKWPGIETAKIVTRKGGFKQVR